MVIEPFIYDFMMFYVYDPFDYGSKMSFDDRALHFPRMSLLVFVYMVKKTLMFSIFFPVQ
jgi:hypothetical protein